MPYALLALMFLLLWAGVTLLLQALSERRERLSLYERLAPFQRPWLADEAERWLRKQ